MSLTSCLAKANDFIDPALKSDLLARAKTLEARGQAAPDASRQAVQEAIDLLTRQLRVATNKAQEVRQSAPREQTQTPAFKKWFGDSKAVDADGQPLRLFHGTGADFSAFASDKVGQNFDASTLGFYFTSAAKPDPLNGFGYGTTASEYAENAPGTPSVMPVYLKIENPLVIDDAGEWGGAAMAIDKQKSDIARWARAGKYDGVIAYDRTGEDLERVYVAFTASQIKSAIGNNGEFDLASRDITRSAPRSPWYSGLQQAIEGVPERLATMAAPQWRLWLDANAAKLGVKKDEIEWSGVKDYLATRGKDKVTKGEIAGYLAANGVKIEETVLGGGPAFNSPSEAVDAIAKSKGETAEWVRDNWGYSNEQEYVTLANNLLGDVNNRNTKYQDYTVPGGTNYREFLLTLPTAGAKDATRRQELAAIDRERHLNLAEQKEYDDLRAKSKSGGAEAYTSSHWDQKNVLAHLRVDDRTDADGNKVLMIQEIQSDWSSDGRKKGFVGQVPTDAEVQAHFGLRDDADPADYRQEMMDTQKGRVPTGPFVTDTKAYVALALKRAIKLAVDEGYDKVAMVTGEQAADFFDLSKKVDSITYEPTATGYYINVMAGGSNIKRGDFTPSELEDIVGKDIVQKMLDKEGKAEAEPGTIDYEHLGNTRTMSGLDLKVGGDGMKAYYNNLVPNVVRDVLKKLGGGKMETVSIASGKRLNDVEFGAQDELIQEATGPDGERGYETTDGTFFESYSDAVDHEQASAANNLEAQDQPGFTLTPAMKEKAEGGMVMFSAKRDSAAVRAGADAIAKLPRSVVDDLEPSQAPGGYASYALYEARKLMPKPSDKIKKVSDSNSLTLWQNYDWVANVDGELFGINKSEDPDYDPYGDKPETDEDDESTAAVETGKWNYNFSRVEDGVTDATTTWHFDKAELIKDIRASMNQRTAAADGMAKFSAKRDPQTETEAFKKWFGDWQDPKAFSSKAKGPVSFAVGKDKQPLTLYHATNADISEFEVGRETVNSTTFGNDITTRHGIFTSPDVKFSEEYLRKGEGQNVMPVYMSIQSPLDMREGLNGDDQTEILAQADGKMTARDFYRMQPTDHWQLFDGEFGANFVEAARKAGFDGAILTEEAPEAGTNHDVYVAFDSSQIKSKTGNNGNFDAGSRDITQSTIRQKIDDAINQPTLSIVGETRRQHTPEQLAAMRRVGFQVETPSLKDRAKALTEGLGKRLAQGVFDQFAPIRDIDDHAYLLTRLSKGASGAFESFLHGGKLKLSDGVYDFDNQARGGVIDKLLTPLGGEHHDFFRWIAANRAERLTAEGKENLFSAEDIAALKTLAEGQAEFDYTLQHGARAGQTTRSRADIYADSLKTFNAFSDNIMDMAEQSGLIDGEARQFWEQEFYVPFYRVADEMEGGVRGMGSKGSMVRQEAFKKLKGGKNMLNADLLDNTLMNWAHLLDASAKNRAAKATLEAAVNLGVAIEANETTVKQMGKSAKTAPVWFMDSGKQRHFIVEDPMLLTAISSLEYAGMRNPVMNAMSMFKHVLTVGVTASPFFKIRNLIRDSVQVIGTSPIGYNPAGNLKQGWKLTDPKSDAYFRLLAGGGTIHFGSMLEGSEAKRVQALVESGVDRATILGDEHAVKAFYRKVIAPLVDGYNELGNRGEAVNRAAMYDQLVKGGMSHAEASLMARDSMDFSMAGSFTSIRFLTQILPFFNARLQGLYKLGKAAHEDPKRMAIVVGAVTLASLGLLAAYGDDDDWKKREDHDRNNFWWFKVGGIAYRIPKPFELGAIGTLAERGFEFMFDDEMTGKRMRSQVLTLLADNLAMNPVPQAFKPILDVYANKDAFSGRPIETPSMEKLRPEYRFTDRTSMVARGASTVLNATTGLIGKDSLSPVQIDQMLRGYFGWLGSFVVGSADVLARPATDQPAQAKSDIWRVATGNIISDLRDAPSRYVSQMYEQSKELEQAYGTHRMLLKSGKADEASEFKKDHAEELGRYKHVENVKQAAAKLNIKRREIERSDLDPVAKREALRKISIEQDRIAKLIK